MTTRIRPATAADAPLLAWVMLAASRSHLPRGIWDVMIGGPDAHCLAFLERLALSDIDTFCRYPGFLVAEVGGQGVAALAGYVGATGTASIDRAVAEAYRALGWEEAALAAANARLGRAAPCFPEQPPEAWIVEWVATRPEFRRRGLVERLLEQILAVGRARGHRVAQISILIGNTPAERAYEKVGFRMADEKRTPEFEATIGAPGIRRFLRPL